MLTKRFTISCQEITSNITKIKIRKADFDNIYHTDIPKALLLKKELQLSISQLKEILNPVFRIEGKEFPVNELEMGGKTGPELATELKNRGINLYDSSEFMLKSSEFVVAKSGEKIPTVRLQVHTLFSDKNTHTFSEILARASELGLDFLPHETAADLLLDEKTQPKMGESYSVISNPIIGQGGGPSVFCLGCLDGGLYLSSFWAGQGNKWNPGNGLMFRVPTK